MENEIKELKELLAEQAYINGVIASKIHKCSKGYKIYDLFILCLNSLTII